jgi:hypothetical protein
MLNLWTTDLFGTRVIVQCRKILITARVARLVKYLKVEEYIFEIIERKKASEFSVSRG